MKKNKLILFVGLGLISFFFGCEVFEVASYKPVYVITVNEIVKYPRAKRLEREISTITGDKIWINTNYYIHSSTIQAIDIVPSKDKTGYYDLKLKLDYHGKLVWMQLSAEYLNKQLAFIIDGVCYKLIQPEKIITEEENVVLVKGPFEKVIAEALMEHSMKNYKYFHQNDY